MRNEKWKTENGKRKMNPPSLANYVRHFLVFQTVSFVLEQYLPRSQPLRSCLLTEANGSLPSSRDMSNLMTSIKLLLALMLCLSSAIAQGGGSLKPGTAAGPHVPEKGSAERKAIVDALRVPVGKQLKQPVIFKIDHLKVQNAWAFLSGRPQNSNGSAIDYTDTVYQDAVDSGAFDDGIVALLRKVKGKWIVVQYVIGATDVPYVDWDKKYRAPKGIFMQ
jgi:hypothetical protein